jgi:glutamyl-tRNA reductase
VRSSVSIIGSGNVAEYLANSFFRHEVEVKEICSRNYLTGKDLADTVNATYVSDIALMSDEVDAIIIAVSDDQIFSVAEILQQKNASLRILQVVLK